MSEPSPSRLLLVTCSENFCKTLRRILSRCGYQVDCARSGEDALSNLSRAGYDAIISEVHLPGEVCGISLMEKVRAAGHAVPMIFLTEQETARIRAAVDSARGVACLQMPLDVDRLKDLVASRCAKSEPPVPGSRSQAV